MSLPLLPGPEATQSQANQGGVELEGLGRRQYVGLGICRIRRRVASRICGHHADVSRSVFFVALDFANMQRRCDGSSKGTVELGICTIALFVSERHSRMLAETAHVLVKALKLDPEARSAVRWHSLARECLACP